MFRDSRLGLKRLTSLTPFVREILRSKHSRRNRVNSARLSVERFEERIAPALLVWTGKSPTSPNWSVVGNWGEYAPDGSVIPALRAPLPGDTLDFSAVGNDKLSVGDIEFNAANPLQKIIIQGRGYQANIELTRDVTVKEVQQHDGRFGGTSTLTIPALGTYTWYGGQLGTGSPQQIVISGNASMEINGSVAIDKSSLTNYGLIDFLGPKLDLYHAGSVQNQSGSTFNFRGDNPIIEALSGGSFYVLQGATAIAATNSSAEVRCWYYNYGTTEVQQNALSLEDYSASTGNYNILLGTRLNFNPLPRSPDYEFQDGTTITGDYAYLVSGTALVSGLVHVDKLQQLSDAFVLNNGTWTFFDAYECNGQALDSTGPLPGITIVATNAVANLNSANLVVRQSIANYGRLTWNSGSMTFKQGASISNVDPGVFTVISSGTIQLGEGVTPNQAAVSNAGRMIFNAAPTIYPYVYESGGQFTLMQGTTKLNYLSQNDGTTFLNGGNLSTIGNPTPVDFSLSGGQLIGSGQINMTMVVDGGTVAPGSPGNTFGTFNITASVEWKHGTAIFEIGGGGRDRINISGRLRITVGTIYVTFLGLPIPPGPFTLFTYASVNGQFTNGSVPNGWTLQYLGGTLQLVRQP